VTDFRIEDERPKPEPPTPPSVAPTPRASLGAPTRETGASWDRTRRLAYGIGALLCGYALVLVPRTSEPPARSPLDLFRAEDGSFSLEWNVFQGHAVALALFALVFAISALVRAGPRRGAVAGLAVAAAFSATASAPPLLEVAIAAVALGVGSGWTSPGSRGARVAAWAAAGILALWLLLSGLVRTKGEEGTLLRAILEESGAPWQGRVLVALFPAAGLLALLTAFGARRTWLGVSLLAVALLLTAGLFLADGLPDRLWSQMPLGDDLLAASDPEPPTTSFWAIWLHGVFLLPAAAAVADLLSGPVSRRSSGGGPPNRPADGAAGRAAHP
jgi:hypothetical protein